MTRKEAIETLKGERWMCCQEKYLEALNFAISDMESREQEYHTYTLKSGRRLRVKHIQDF